MDEYSLIESAGGLGEPIAFIHEGLLVYFTHEERLIFGENVRRLLERKGGVWISPDLMYKDLMKRRIESRPPERRKVVELCLAAIHGISERNMLENSFENEADADRFFDELGFSIEKHRRYDGGYKIFSLENVLPEQRDEVLDTHRKGDIYITRLK
jgi:O-methyltransferase involved in polyketide biosynthesis